MQHRTSSPCTQSGASVEFRVVILVLSKHFFVFSARVSLKQRAIKTRTPTRHRRIITPRSGLGTFSARLVFWKAEIKARTSVPLPGTCGSRRARPVRIFHGAFHTTVSTGRAKIWGCCCMIARTFFNSSMNSWISSCNIDLDPALCSGGRRPRSTVDGGRRKRSAKGRDQRRPKAGVGAKYPAASTTTIAIATDSFPPLQSCISGAQEQ